MTLRRREKRRYISVIHGCRTDEAVAVIERRLQELYGAIVLERAYIKVIRSGEGVSIFRCALGFEQKVLVSIALACPPMTALDMSSSAKRLKRRLAAKVNTVLLAKRGGDEVSFAAPD